MADINNISENLFSSIRMIVDDSINKASFDKSYLCSISNVETTDDGRYKYILEYSEGNKTITVYDTIRYLQNSKVWVSVPEGDWNSTGIYIVKKYIDSDRGEIDILSYDYNFNNVSGKINISSTYSQAIDASYRKKMKQDTDVLDLVAFGGKLKVSEYKTDNSFTITLQVGFIMDKDYVRENYKQNYYYIHNNNTLQLNDEEYFDDFIANYYRIKTFTINSSDFFCNYQKCTESLPYFAVWELETDDEITNFADARFIVFELASKGATLTATDLFCAFGKNKVGETEE